MSIKQAIEALEELVEYAEEAGFDWSLDNARAALAALRSMPAEPVAWAIFTDAGNARMWTTFQPHVQKLADAEGLKVTPLYASPQQAIEPEPRYTLDQIHQALLDHGVMSDTEREDILAGLLATPHTAHLSDAEIDDLAVIHLGNPGIDPTNFARAVEQATAARLGVKMGDV